MKPLSAFVLVGCLVGSTLGQPPPILNGQVNPSIPGSPVRDLLRLNAGGLNPSSSNAQDGAGIASRGQTFVAVWAEQNGFNNNVQDIWFSRSLDGGLNWSAPIRIDVADPPNASDADFPQVVFVDKPAPGPGQVPYNIVVAYETNFANAGNALDDVGMVVSTDGGSSFQLATPHLVNQGPGTLNNEIDEIWLASEGTNVYVVWEEDGQTVPTCTFGNESTLFTRSLDGGLTYEPPQVINTVVLTNPVDPCSVNDVATPMVVARGSEVWATYTDNRAGNERIHIAYSPLAGAPGSWNDVMIESAPIGDVNHPRIAVRRSGTPGSSMVVVTWEDDDPGQYVLKMAISTDSGVNWSPEILVTPDVLNVTSAGVSADYLGYHKHVVMADGRIYVIWLDDHEAASLGLTPNRGDTPGSRQLYFAAFDASGAVLVAPVNVDPGVSNQFPDLVANGDTIFIHVERNPFGGNDLIYAASTDVGLTWRRFLVPNSVVGDVDSIGYTVRQGPGFVADWENHAAMAVFWNNPTGRNEVYAAGLRLPYLTRTINATTGLTSLGIAAVPQPVGGSPFQIALSATGIYPVLQIGADYIPLAVDQLTLDSLFQPFLLPFLTGTIDVAGNGIAFAGFISPPPPLNIFAAGATLLPGGIDFSDGFRY